MEQNGDLQKKRTFLIRFAYITVILGLIICACRFLLPELVPFLIAFCVAILAKPAVRFLGDRLHFNRKAAGIISVILLYILLGTLIVLLGVRLVDYARELVMGIPAFYTDTLEPLIGGFFDWLQRFTARLDPAAAESIESFIGQASAQIESGLGSLTARMLGKLTTFAFGLPNLFINTLIAIIATVFMAADWNRIWEFCRHQLSLEHRDMADKVVTNLVSTLKQYIRSYALILFITFCELMAGFLILGIKNPVQTAIPIAIFDILPVVGSGTILMPWAIISLLTGNWPRALGLALQYVCIAVIRNILEPKLVGTRVGLHPLVTLLAMVIGGFAFGPVGILGLPVALALIVTMNEQGIIHMYKALPSGKKRRGESSKEAVDCADPVKFTGTDPGVPAGTVSPVEPCPAKKKDPASLPEFRTAKPVETEKKGTPKTDWKDMFGFLKRKGK